MNHGGASWELGPLSLSSWLPEWPSCGIYINIPCKYFTEGSVYLQDNVMLYIQKSFSENAGISVIGVEKYKNFLGENTPRPPYYLMRFHTKHFVTNNHLSFLHTWYSMVPFCRCPPPPHWRTLKKCFNYVLGMPKGHIFAWWRTWFFCYSSVDNVLSPSRAVARETA